MKQVQFWKKLDKFLKSNQIERMSIPLEDALVILSINAKIAKKNRTNGDFIRSMNDEQLAEWMHAHMEGNCTVCPANSKPCCKDWLVEWLGAEFRKDK